MCQGIFSNLDYTESYEALQNKENMRNTAEAMIQEMGYSPFKLNLKIGEDSITTNFEP